VAVTLALATPPVTAAYADTSSESAVSALIDNAAGSPTKLRVLLREMPKGGDLHNHLSGAIYAEDYIEWAREAGFCTEGAAIALPPCPVRQGAPASADARSGAEARLIDSLSTRGYRQGIGRNEVSGHTQFFQTFDKFAPIAARSTARMLVAERRIAAGDRLSYLELDHDTRTLSEYIGSSPAGPLDEAGLAARYAEEIARVGPLLGKASAELDRDEATVRRDLGCDGPHPEPGCAVTVRYLFQGFRAVPPGYVFRSLVLAFAMADHDPRFVGVNIVQPEDDVLALRDYDLHMAMFRFLEAKYPNVRRSLHAGELTLGFVAPQHLRDHIAKAVASGAQRIGHGTDIAFEEGARETMAKMAREGIAVEINLTSNDVILGVSGVDHPLSLYRSMGVPVVLATDDQGVLRTDMTNEYVRAVRDQGLHYGELKNIARAGITYSFLPGESLWKDRKPGTPVAACAASFAEAGCRRLLAASEKARMEADLETRFDSYERTLLAVPATLQ